MVARTLFLHTGLLKFPKPLRFPPPLKPLENGRCTGFLREDAPNPLPTNLRAPAPRPRTTKPPTPGRNAFDLGRFGLGNLPTLSSTNEMLFSSSVPSKMSCLSCPAPGRSCLFVGLPGEPKPNFLGLILFFTFGLFLGGAVIRNRFNCRTPESVR